MTPATDTDKKDATADAKAAPDTPATKESDADTKVESADADAVETKEEAGPDPMIAPVVNGFRWFAKVMELFLHLLFCKDT